MNKPKKLNNSDLEQIVGGVRPKSSKRVPKKIPSRKKKASVLDVCPQCSGPKLPHRICPNCGYYDGIDNIPEDEDY